MYRYFLAYAWNAGPSSGFGSFVVELTEQIRTSAQIVELAARAESSGPLPIGARVAITNIVSLDWPT